MNYTPGFKARMVKRMSGRGSVTATELAAEVGVPQPTLSRWKREARTVPGMSGSSKSSKDREKSPRQWSAAEKLRVLQESAALSEDDLGEFLRREGLHTTQLEEWRRLATSAAQEALAGPRKRAKKSPEARRIKELEKELRRKEKALAEVAALLALKKKAQAIWGDEDDDMHTKSET